MPQQIVGDWNYLLRIPKKVLIDYLLRGSQDQESLRLAFKKVTSSMKGVSETALIDLSHSDIVRIFQECTSIDEEVARTLHEDYRYIGMKSIYIYEFWNIGSFRDINLGLINSDLKEKCEEYRSGHIAFKFSNLQIENSDELDDNLSEFSYSYVAKVQVVDPKDRCPTLVDDLRLGFIWVHKEEGWGAICAKDEIISQILIKAFENSYTFKATLTHIPKSIMENLETLSSIRRVAYYDPLSGTRRRLTNPNMSEDDIAMHEIRSREESDERSACGYNEELADGTTFALGYSNDKGKYSFKWILPYLR